MSAQHTPGPWVTADGHGPIKGGTAVQSTNDTHLICSCTGYYGRDGAQAHARLIAAAPDLLEALKAVLKDEKWHAAMADEVTDGARDNIKMAEAAIAKATGSAS